MPLYGSNIPNSHSDRTKIPEIVLLERFPAKSLVTPVENQYVIDETQETIERFEATGMEDEMPEDYDKLLGILDDAVKQQREHTRVMLGFS